jgi:hypothetical protein
VTADSRWQAAGVVGDYSKVKIATDWVTPHRFFGLLLLLLHGLSCVVVTTSDWLLLLLLRMQLSSA